MSFDISIVTPSYNQARFLEQTMRSVLEQGCSVEYIVVDGGSSDGTVDLLERYSDRLAYWQSCKDGGQTDALNQGMARATAEIVGWINSDDYYLPGAFRTVLERFAAKDRPDVVFGNAVTVGEAGEFIRENRHGSFSLAALGTSGMDVNQQAMFWRRELDARVLPLDPSLRFCMDLELLVKLGVAGARFTRIPDVLGAFRLHGASKTSNLEDVRRQEQTQILDRYALRGRQMAGPVWLRTLRSQVARRTAMLADGAFLYATVGGRLGASRASRRANASAAKWATKE